MEAAMLVKVDTLYAWIMTDNDGNESLCFMSTGAESADVPMVDSEIRYAGAADCIDNPKGYKVERRAFMTIPKALIVLREPTDAMVEAGFHQHSGDPRRQDVKDAWQAMIDAAISGTGDTQ